MKTDILEKIRQLHKIQEEIYDFAKIEVDAVFDYENPARDLFLVPFIPFHVGKMVEMLSQLRKISKEIEKNNER